MKRFLVTWCVMLGLLLQSAAWALPFERAQQTERLAHAVAHALDHGHHDHGGPGFAVPLSTLTLADSAHGHDVDPALQLDDELASVHGAGHHGPHHLHASEGATLQGLPVSAGQPTLAVEGLALRPWAELQPPSAELAGWLRPPRAAA